jgi:hypothetical protein
MGIPKRSLATSVGADVIAFTVARHELEVALGDLGNYVNTVANGSAVIVEKSGFPSYETAHAPDRARRPRRAMCAYATAI